MGTARKAAKLSIASAQTESFSGLSNLIISRSGQDDGIAQTAHQDDRHIESSQ
jgi:hypothetical protein